MSLKDSQLETAAIIIKVGHDVGATKDQIIAALSAAWVESRLGVLDGGDNGTAWGVFQQRPVAGWGSKSYVQNTYNAARSFYTGIGSNRGLLDVWTDTRTPGLNVQAVQRSGFPYRYDRAMSFARGVLSEIQSYLSPDDVTSLDRSVAIPQQQTSPISKPYQGNPASARLILLTVGGLLVILALIHLKG